MAARQSDPGKRVDSKKQAILVRIKELEERIANGKSYLEGGQHADWNRFRPLFDTKSRGGNALPPHRDWVKNVFLRRAEKALSQAEKLLQRFS
jgi:hypothetical protein